MRYTYIEIKEVRGKHNLRFIVLLNSPSCVRRETDGLRFLQSSPSSKQLEAEACSARKL
jgi:hypothetical protein